MKPQRIEILKHGVLAGIIGYAVVVVFYAVFNVVNGRSPFYTAALLGQAAFFDLGEPIDGVVSPGPVLAFNGLHIVVFAIVGILTAWLATASERGVSLWYVGLSLVIYGLIHGVGVVLWVAEPFRAEIPAWSVLLSTTLAVGAMALYLLRAHPRLRRELRDEEAEEERTA